ncbi:hypothetical protein CIB48_g12087 [Xylaria polymorpha]|nr:hypothetical protein CIB48_g12087 [Xylaria polymorpha]
MTQKDELVRRFNSPDNPRFVVRYDHRDTGLSTSFTKTSDDFPVYSLDDLVDDAVGLIEHLNLDGVHLIAWPSSSQAQSGVNKLPTISCRPVHLEGQWLLGEAFSVPEDKDDDEGWIQSYMSMDLALATKPPTEAERAESRRDSEVTYRREKESGTMWTKYNHSDASGPRWPRESLKLIRCPTVVIHAAKDQIFPMKHGEALRDEVEGATLVVLEDCGHEVPHRVRQQLSDAILANVEKGEQMKAAKN